MRSPHFATLAALLAAQAAPAVSGCVPSSGTAQPSPATASRPLAPADRFPLATADDRTVCAELNRAPTEFRDPEPTLRRKLLISDLHLGAGSASGEATDRLEDFFYPGELDQLLTDQGQRGPTDLIIAGDFIDFWQILGEIGDTTEPTTDAVTTSATRLGSDQTRALAALELAVRAHRDVFDRLRRFVDEGDNRLILIPGNHDAELLFPRVRRDLARALGAEHSDRVLLLSTRSYVHGGVHVEHGHYFDSANVAPSAELAAVDSRGRCRLMSSWGHIFVAEFFNRVEERHPFADNLYPETATLLWAMEDEPGRLEAALVAASLIDTLSSAQSGPLNLSAISAAVGNTFGTLAPSSGTGGGVGDTVGEAVWRRLPSRDTWWRSLGLLLTDPELAGVREVLFRAAEKLPNAGGAISELLTLDLDEVRRARKRLFGDTMLTAAHRLLGERKDVSVVVMGHTHDMGGRIEEIRTGERVGTYANTGAWVPTRSAEALQASGIAWSQIDVTDRALFSWPLPAVVIDYDGTRPRAPVIITSGRSVAETEPDRR